MKITVEGEEEEVIDVQWTMNVPDPEAITRFLALRPVGYRFVPTDEELLKYYLRPKVRKEVLPLNRMYDVQFYEYSPFDLAFACLPWDEADWYFFTHRDRQLPNGQRAQRAARGGYWKISGADKLITARSPQEVMGARKILVYYRGNPNIRQKTNWIMHEYRLEGLDNMTLDDWVLCKLYWKRDGFGRPRKPRITAAPAPAPAPAPPPPRQEYHQAPPPQSNNDPALPDRLQQNYDPAPSPLDPNRFQPISPLRLPPPLLLPRQPGLLRALSFAQYHPGQFTHGHISNAYHTMMSSTNYRPFLSIFPARIGYNGNVPPQNLISEGRGEMRNTQPPDLVANMPEYPPPHSSSSSSNNLPPSSVNDLSPAAFPTTDAASSASDDLTSSFDQHEFHPHHP